MASFADMTPRQRSEHMARIRGRDTLPERHVRDFFREAAIKFTTHARDLPGTPDVVVREKKVAVFVHGCFWHQHGCRRLKPKANQAYWEKKFAANVRRDRGAARRLRAMGWRVLVVWECQARASVAWRDRVLAVVGSDRRRCHDCSRIAVRGYAHCKYCRPRYSKDAPQERPSKKSARDPAMRARRRRLGLCTRCGMPAKGALCPHDLNEGRTRSHRAKAKPGYKSARERREEAGFCRCKAPLKPGHKRCEKCLRRLRREAKERNARYYAEGRCRYCPTKVRKGELACAKHRQRLRAVTPIYVQAMVKRRRDAGKCAECGRPSKTYTCRRCKNNANKRAREKRDKREAAGKCTTCGRKARSPHKLCARCRARGRRRYYHDRRVHGA